MRGKGEGEGLLALLSRGYQDDHCYDCNNDQQEDDKSSDVQWFGLAIKVHVRICCISRVVHDPVTIPLRERDRVPQGIGVETILIRGRGGPPPEAPPHRAPPLRLR